LVPTISNRRRRRAILRAVAIPTGLALLLGLEVIHAIGGADLPEREPYELSGLVGQGPTDDPLRIAWIGDSVAAGVGASGPDAALPRVVATSIDGPVELHVFAESGERAAGALEDQVPRVTALMPSPDVVIVEVGANDVTHLTGRQTFSATYDRILARVADLDARHLLALGIPAFGTSPRFLQPLRAIVGFRGRQLDEEIRTAAEAHGATYVDIAAATGGEFAADPDHYYAQDDFHPSDAGYDLWARAVLEALGREGIS
jgi:lysophospholipase L1-like esterase